MLNRPEVTEERILQIKEILAENPDWNRSKLSRHICEIWDWRIPGGNLKDISCRDMLRSLENAGKIILPAPMRIQKSQKRQINHLNHDTTPINVKLSDLQPLKIDIAEQGAELKEFKSLIDTYHYLGYDRSVGENMKYIVRANTGEIIACSLFGSAAWKCRDRDMFIGWGASQRVKGLYMMTNNTRFLILPWVRANHLASHTLSKISRRVAKDWESKYGHKIFCLETYVECGRFAGTCYKAANWVLVGRTAGRGRDDRYNTASLPIKDIYLYPLSRNYREVLTGHQNNKE